MNRKRLHGGLENALTSAPATASPTSLRELNLWMHAAYSGSAGADSHAVNLLRALRLEPELKIFDGQFLHVLSIGPHAVELWHLAAWLLGRAQSLGSRQAISDLTRYLKATVIPYQIVIVVSGLSPDNSYNMGQDISFIPWEKLRITSQKQSIHERFVMGGVPFHFPSGVLIQTQKSRKLVVSNHEFSKDPTKYGAQQGGELYDCLLCLALVEPSAPQVLASWAETPGWVPLFGGGITLTQPEGISRQQQFSSDAHIEARKLFRKFSSASASLQARLRLVIPRLIRASRHLNPVDTAIDLGIALEALYLSDMNGDRGELSYRLRTRAARFLGRTRTERKKISALLRDIYTLRSKAVHTGDSAQMNVKKAPAHGILQQGISVVAQTARLFVIDGQPTWDDVMFK